MAMLVLGLVLVLEVRVGGVHSRRRPLPQRETVARVFQVVAATAYIAVGGWRWRRAAGHREERPDELGDGVSDHPAEHVQAKSHALGVSGCCDWRETEQVERGGGRVS